MKKYIVEALGTFTLTLVVSLSLSGTFPVPTPVLAALTLGLFVYSVGHISGTHINPAVTIGAWSIKKIDTQDTVMYIISQFIGAGLALIVSSVISHPITLTVAATFPVFFAEALGTFFFTFGIAAVIYNKVPSVMNGIVIGGSLLLGISIAAVISNGVLNPAVAFGIGSFSWSYALGPIVGSILGMQAFSWLERSS